MVFFLLPIVEFQMLVCVIHMVHNCLFICFVLVKDGQNVIYVSFVIYYFFAFQPLFYIHFFQKMKVMLCYGAVLM